ncbi:unnamed protein product [Oncorhynchus mykiss]|uniref:Reverse transcriptase domain-containing protein n=1 Tax=Oncorhynchus mykiss TaxID=8022 RepID=A0A060ZG51_ONCMY|nr:unnamed protein product [Oncorhynchus mykiss]
MIKYTDHKFQLICVNNNLGKIVCIIINSRLVHFLSENNVVRKCHVGVLPNYRTTDHVFILHSPLDKQTKAVFSCFVYFKKAFHSIWHEGLQYKLMESGVGGENIQHYKIHVHKTTSVIKLATHTHFFPQGHGLRQGCSLSPTRFNIYINELARTLEQSVAPILTLLESEVKCLLFADDLVLLSPTKEGL